MTCELDVKHCKVTFAHTGRDDEVIVGIGPHQHESEIVEPIVTTRLPYEGPLCAHERDWVGGIPVKHSDHWMFSLKEAKE